MNREDQEICQPQCRTERTLEHENRGNNTSCHWLHRNSGQKVCWLCGEIPSPIKYW